MRAMAVLEDALALYLTDVERERALPRLRNYAAFVRDELEPAAWEVDKHARPYLQSHDQFGADIDEVVLSGAHRNALLPLSG